MTIIEQNPQWGVNYDLGFDGFTSRQKDFLSAGINWFERWDAIPGTPPVSHAFKIVGPDLTIEALVTGVTHGKLSPHINDPNCSVIIRRPAGWTPDMGLRLLSAMESHLGEKYNYLMIIMMAIGKSYLGHGIDLLTRGKFSVWLEKLADNKRHDICSSVVARADNAITELRNRGVLKTPPFEITPIMLCGDTVIYEPGAIELVP